MYMCVIVNVDLPRGWEMNITAGQPYYVEYVLKLIVISEPVL